MAVQALAPVSVIQPVPDLTENAAVPRIVVVEDAVEVEVVAVQCRHVLEPRSLGAGAGIVESDVVVFPALLQLEPVIDGE